MDTNSNDVYDAGVDPVSNWNGPWVLDAQNYSYPIYVWTELYDPNSSGGTGRVEGNINYPGFQSPGKCHVVLSSNSINPIVAGYKLVEDKVFDYPQYPVYYTV